MPCLSLPRIEHLMQAPWLSSVVKKQVMALTGLLMCGFLLVHLAGNFLIFSSPEAFNQYAHFMLNNPLIMIAEWGLVVLFGVHACMGIVLIFENRGARDERYVIRKTRLKGSSLSLVSMAITGPLLLVFLVLHLAHFRFGPEYTVAAGGLEVRDLYRVVADYYRDPLDALFYVVCMGIVAVHVQHGFWSAFQSLGINHPHYNRWLEVASNGFAALVLFGFGVIPISFISW